MARLKALPPRLATLPPRIGVAPGDERERARHRDATVHWRAWYKTERWRRLRAKVLARDLYTCRKTGVLLVGRYPADNSAVVDHIVPHRGDERLFWDETNLMAVSKAWHDSVKQSIERRGEAGRIA